MNTQTLLECRLTLWRERLSRMNAGANAGERRTGLVDIDTAEAQATAVVAELEHLVGSLSTPPRGRRAY